MIGGGRRMKDILVLIHTVSPLIEVFERLTAEMLPGVSVRHILDEPLLEPVKSSLMRSDEFQLNRLKNHIEIAEEIGAKAVLVTCSTISPLVEILLPFSGIPIFNIDTPMIEAAVQLGSKIGVLATNPSTIKPTSRLISENAASTGRSVQVETKLVDNAFKALLSGNSELHNQLVDAAIKEISGKVEVIVLAQASMASVIDDPHHSNISVPVLSSPKLALEKLKPEFQQEQDVDVDKEKKILL
jgi:Asp/Glu/hydantoin racemase